MSRKSESKTRVRGEVREIIKKRVLKRKNKTKRWRKDTEEHESGKD